MSEIIEGPYLDFIFKVGDGPLCEFVEVEDMSGKSVNAGQWIKRDGGYTALRVFLYAQGQASKEARVKELEEKLKEAIDLLDGIYQTPKECDTCFCMPDGQICEGHEALKKLKAE